ncbi:MAG: YggT family protein [Chloroflexi bacterium]|nr:YggT family protein [Chloroflexota bacterium]MCH8348758.1 YggT family protein [Chloroflexota bacterium]MCI0781092.1 YggT family protein [Chloroflexota bacterium]MCI0784675.1 YggT family protein [Chloroflexota bacterium]MCI0823418.1 YggT family protein [Chloroflexota bacterium]
MLEFLLGLLDRVLLLFIFAIVGRAILSFVIPMLGERPHPVLITINNLLAQVTEPMVGPLRRVLPTIGMLDLSPMVAIIVLAFIRNLLSRGI